MTDARKKGIGCIALLIFGIMLGRLGSGTSEERVVYVDKPGPTKTVTQTYMPEYCVRALDMAVKIRDEAGKFDTAAGPQLDLISDIQVAIVSRNVGELNELTVKQHALRTKTQDAASVLQGDLNNYTWVLSKCKEKLGDQ